MIAAHADWSVDPRKRWITLAARTGASWRVFAPTLVGDVGALLARLRHSAAGKAIVLGLDMPVGIPRAYAERHATQRDFPSFLRALATRPAFFDVCDEVADISAERPFYPRVGVKGMTLNAHVAALGFTSRAQMNRLCDLKTAERPAGASLFWTLGANQVGKAALSGWRDLLLPCLMGSDPAHLWPFDGRLSALVARGGITIAETYPAEALRQLGLRFSGSKRRQTDRISIAPQLRDAIAGLDAECDEALASALSDGFGAKADGEDRFDSVLGLLCVLNVLAGRRNDDAPDDPWIRNWEGWVLGQTAPASSMPHPPRSTPPPPR